MAKKNIKKIIETPKRIIDTANPLDNNKIITNVDRVSIDELSDIVSSPITDVGQPIPVINTDTLDSNDAQILLKEEAKRREIETARQLDVDAAYKIDPMFYP